MCQEAMNSMRLSNVRHSQPMLESSYDLISVSSRTHTGTKAYAMNGILGHTTKCAMRSTLFTLQKCPFNTTSSAARPTQNNGRMTVNDELGRMWKKMTVVYGALGDCLESRNSHTNLFQSRQQTFGPPNKTATSCIRNRSANHFMACYRIMPHKQL